MYPNNKEEHDYNMAANSSYLYENMLMQKAQEYGEFCVLCDRQGMNIILFEDFLKLRNKNQ